jgi:hydroxyethylthiazole kinase-like uncharacterized protein yjeF
VIGLAPTREGNISGARALPELRSSLEKADAVLLGPGMDGDRAAETLAPLAARHLGDDTTLILDAVAIFALRRNRNMLNTLAGHAVITPHAGEMATLVGAEKSDVQENAAAVAMEAAQRFGVIVALKGAESWIASPDGSLFRYASGSVGLATSGSGDTLAGIIAGLAARCGDPVVATCWAVWAHGTAGTRLARRVANVGFLARELLAEVPALVGRAQP